MDALTLHRLHFAFTITYHYLFPQLTMGLALLIVVLKTLALKTGKERYDVAARFWARILRLPSQPPDLDCWRPEQTAHTRDRRLKSAWFQRR